MKRKVSILHIGIISLFFVFLNTVPLYAQIIRCEGVVCESEIFREINSEISNLEVQLREDYGKGLAKSFSEAHVASNLALQPYIGGLKLDHFTLGAKFSGGLEKTGGQKTNPSGRESKRPEALKGAAVQIFGYGGVNLGFIFGLLGASTDFLDDTDVFIGKLNVNTRVNELPGFPGASATFRSKASYAGISHSIIDSFGWAILGQWLGLSFSASYLDSALDVILRLKDKDDSTEFQFQDFNWLGSMEVELASREYSHSFELNTGVRALYFLTITMGGGVSFHSGRTLVKLSRSGKIYRDNIEINANFIATLSDLQYTKEERYYYYKAGAEFNLPFTRIGVSGYYVNKNLYGASLDTRLDF